MLLHALLVGCQDCLYCRITLFSKSISHNYRFNFPQFHYKPFIVLLARSRDTHSFEATVSLLILLPHFPVWFHFDLGREMNNEEELKDVILWFSFSWRSLVSRPTQKVRKSNGFCKDNSSKFSTAKWQTFPWKKKQLKMITHKKAKNEHVVKKRFVHILIDSRVFSIKLLFLENIDSESFRIK